MKKRRSLLHATLWVSVLALVGKILGFGREALIAAFYGATAETDAFFFAQSMPNMIFPAVSGSISTALTSLYVKRLTEQGEAAGDRYASRMLTATTLLGCFLSLLGILLSPLLVPLFAPGFTGAQQTLAIRLTRLTMAGFSLYFLHYILGAILNSKKMFISSQSSALAYNAAIIVVILLFGRGRSMEFLTLTVVFGTTIQVLGMLLCCHGHFHYTGRLNPFHQETTELLRLALPILLGNSVLQLNTIVDKALSSLLPDGSLSALTYGNSLYSLVIGVFVTSLSTVLYPSLTSMAASRNEKQYGSILLQALNGLLLLLIPISCITLLTADDIVTAVYARGSFDRTAVTYTALVLSCYAPQFVFSGIQEVLTRGFFAIQDTKTPAKISAIGVGCNIVFSLLFVRVLGIAGIALGTTVSALVSACLLLRKAHRKIPTLRLSAFFRQTGIQLAAGICLAAALWLFRHFVTIPIAILNFIVSALFGFAVYFLILLPVNGRELREMLRSFLAEK